MPSARGLLISGAGLLCISSVPALVAGFASAGSPVALPVTSVVMVVVTAIGVVTVYVKDRRASRRAIEKSLFGKVLNRQERRKLAPLYQAGKARVKADAKADKAALKAEEKLRRRELKKVGIVQPIPKVPTLDELSGRAAAASSIADGSGLIPGPNFAPAITRVDGTSTPTPGTPT
ncbi:hypothetical protein TWF696_005851 [Orbilia brochopaga]|uniref:Uncharacterized protein n=1 Tax=Orbilia brochopaga TaxID=3140254 RepID=A0AAV9UXS0_9PEZI